MDDQEAHTIEKLQREKAEEKKKKKPRHSIETPSLEQQIETPLIKTADMTDVQYKQYLELYEKILGQYTLSQSDATILWQFVTKTSVKQTQEIVLEEGDAYSLLLILDCGILIFVFSL